MGVILLSAYYTITIHTDLQPLTEGVVTIPFYYRIYYRGIYRALSVLVVQLCAVTTRLGLLSVCERQVEV